MADDSKSEEKKTLSLSGKLKLGARPGEAGQIRQSFSHGRSKTVAVEVRRRRPLERGSLEETALKSGAAPGSAAAGSAASGELTASEWESRLKAVQGALQGGEADALERERQRWAEQEAQRLRDEADAKARAEEEQRKLEEEQAKAKEQPKEKTAAPQAEPAAKSEAPSKVEAAVQPAVKADSPATTGYTPPRVFMTEVVIPKASSRPAPTPAPAVKPAQPEAAAAPAPRRPEGQAVRAFDDLEDESGVKKAPAGRSTARKAGAELQKKMNKNQLHRLTFADVVSGEDEDRPLGGPRTYRRKMSRGRDKAKRAQNIAESMKIVREVIIPEVISVQELS
ncbi:MAG: translation initiation factor IF-2 associated domain-containing protein, partial [Holosporales bacterium]